MILSTEDPKARAELENRYAALVSETAGRELAEAAATFDAEWKATLRYAPATLFVLLGTPPSPAFVLLRTENFNPPPG